MTHDETMAIKRETALQLIDEFYDAGTLLHGQANVMREYVEREYPPPPKRVRAEVKGQWAYQLMGSYWSMGDGASYRTIMTREVDAMYALQQRADADGMVLEGETATPQPQQKAREWWLNVYKDDDGSFAHPSVETANEHAGAARLACVHVREVLPTETPALGTPGNPVTREQVEKAGAKLRDVVYGKGMRMPWGEVAATVFRAIGLEVAE